MKTFFIAAMLFTICTTSFAQKTFETKEVFKNENGNTLLAKFKDVTVASTPTNDFAMLESIYGKVQNVSFKYLREFKNKEGYINKMYQQYSNNIKIEGAFFSLHTVNEKLESISGNYAKNLPSYLIHNLYSTEAETIAINLETSKSTNNDFKSKGYEIVYSKNEIKSLKEYKLAYKVLLFSKITNNLKYYVIDANTGDLLNIEYTNCTGNSVGTGATLYSGSKSITTDDFNTGTLYRLSEVRNGVTISTLNNNNSTNETGTFATEFTDNDNNWTAAEHPNDRAALDAHWGAEQVFDYWRSVFGRNSLNDSGMTIRCYVHYGTNYDNGFWSFTNNVVLYGDGNTVERPVTSLDWCCHEFGHGICQFTSNLTYNNGESGALNEGFSDIWAACIEGWAAPTKQKWLIFEETTIPSPYHERNMANPADGRYPQPDTYGGPHWGDLSNDPHINSGVLNHWFYLLSEGGSGINGISNSFAVSGIGINNAARIAYATEKRLSSGATYQNARTESIQAATDSFGICSNEVIQVMNAWYAVGVGASHISTTAAVSGANPICSSETYSITNLPSGANNIIWHTNASNISFSSTNTNPTTIANVSNGTVSVYASFNTTSGCLITPHVVITLGTPKFTISGTEAFYLSGSMFDYSPNGPGNSLSVCPNESLVFTPYFPSTFNQSTISGHEWTVTGVSATNLYNASLSVVAPSTHPSSFNFSYRYQNACGFSPYYYGTAATRDCAGGEDPFRKTGIPTTVSIDNDTKLSIYPNPAHTNLYITIPSDSFDIARTFIRITDLQGRQLKKIPVVTKNNTVNISNLAKGTYIVEVTDGKKNILKKVIKN